MSYLKSSRLLLVVVIICVIFAAVAQIFAATYIQTVVDDLQADFATGNNSAALLHLGINVLTLLGIYVVAVAATYLQSVLMIRVAQKTVNTIRGDLFDKMQELPIRYFDTNTHGELMSRYTNDIDTISESLNTSIVQLFSSVITLVGTLVAMLSKSPLLTLVAVIILPVMMLIASTIIKKSRKNFMEQQKTLGAVNGYIEEMMEGQKVVKVFCYEDEVKEKFSGLNEAYRKAGTGRRLPLA